MMNHVLLFDLDQNRRRLEYYLHLKSTFPAKSSQPKTPKETAIDKWIEIYSDRVRKLERQATKLGLNTGSMGAAQKKTPAAQWA